MAKVNTKYGSMSEDKVAMMFSAKVQDIGKLVILPSNQPAKYKSVDLVLDARMWPIIAPVLKVEGQSGDARLDFELVADWFNAQAAEIGSSDGMPMKKLTAGETRKALMTATRKHYADAGKALAVAVSGEAKELAAAENDEAKAEVKAKWDVVKVNAQAKRDEAKDILKRQGWTSKVVGRSKKSLAPGDDNGGGKPKSDEKAAGLPTEETPANAKSTSQTKVKAETPVKKSQAKPANDEVKNTTAPEQTIPSKPAIPPEKPLEPAGKLKDTAKDSITMESTPDGVRYYVSGYGRPHFNALKNKLKGILDETKKPKTWYFQTREAADEASKLMHAEN